MLCFVTIRQQAITWTNVDLALVAVWRHHATMIWYASLDALVGPPGKGKYHLTFRWRHNECDGISNQPPHDCLLNRLFKHRSKKTSKLRVTGLWAGNSPVTGEFPAQIASNAEKVSYLMRLWWFWINRPISQIPECTCCISHNASFRTEMHTFLFWMERCGIWNRCILRFVN